MSYIVELLTQIPLFANLPLPQTRLIASKVKMKTFNKGEVIVARGKATRVLSILASGGAQVVIKGSRQNEVILTTLKARDYVGEISLMDGGDHSADVVATESSDVLLLSAEDLFDCLDGNPSLSMGLMQGLAKRFRAANEKIESLALLDVYGRVARALLESAQNEQKIAPKVSKQTMGKMIGASREMVTKVFKELEKRGMIEVLSDGRIQIKDGMMTLL
jgi:CRP/FNR family transcriptional regulator, cyclic AMP receptor protein